MKIKHIESESDYEIYAGIRKESLELDEYNLLMYPEEETYEYEKQKDSHFFKNLFIMVQEDIVIGYAWYGQVWQHSQAKHNFYIWPIYVSPNYRWSSVWTKLLQAVENEIFEKYKLSKIVVSLQVNQNSLSSVKLYLKNGYKVCGTNPDFIRTKEWNYISTYSMSKIIERK